MEHCGIETGFRGTALYATENIAGRINARLEDEGFRGEA